MQKHKFSPMQINTYQFMFNVSKRKSILHELYLILCAFESTFPHKRNTDLVPKRCLYLDIDVMFRIQLRILQIQKEKFKCLLSNGKAKRSIT